MSFPATPLDVRLVFAFGANLASAPTSWIFKDCTADLRTTSDSAVAISVGRSNRAKQGEPNNATFALNNFNSQYTVDHPGSVNYPNVVENVPGIVGVARNPNPTFEVDASDWAATNGTVARSTVRALTSAGSLLLTATGGFASCSANMVAKVPVRPRGFVYVDAWLFSVAGYPSYSVAVDWYDAGGAFISTISNIIAAAPAGVWTYVNGYMGPAPSNAAQCVGRVVQTGTPGAGNQTWIDEARLTIPEMCGYVDGWTPVFDDSGKLPTVNVSMSSSRRRLSKGEPPANSALYRAIALSSPQPVAYWPFEDGSQAQQANSPIPGVPAATFRYQQAIGSPHFAAVTGPPGSDNLPDFSRQAAFQATIPTATGTVWRAQCVAKVNPLPTSSDYVNPLQVFTSGGAVINGLFIAKSGGILNGFTFQDNNSNTFSTGVAYDDGLWHELRMVMTQSGGNIILNVFVDGVLQINQTYAGTINGMSGLNGSASPLANADGYACGHFVVWNTNTGIPDTVDAMNGHFGETAAARIVRFCGEDNVPVASVNNANASMAMGPQGVMSLLDNLDECENADGGLLHEPFDTFGFGYLVRSDLYALPVAFTLDAAQDQLAPPFAPIHDDAPRVNYVTVTRKGGTSVTYIGDTSHGIYKDAPTVNVALDAQLAAIAIWRAHVGSPLSRLRYPSLNVNFGNTNAAPFGPLFAATLGVGIRVQAINLPSQVYLPVDILVLGYTKTLAYRTWKLGLLGSPFDPWNVYALDSNFPLELDGQTLAAGLAPGVTSMSIATVAGKPLLSTAAGDYPSDFNVGGWRVHVTAVAGAASPQTATITAAPNNTTIPAGTTVTLWQSPVLGL